LTNDNNAKLVSVDGVVISRNQKVLNANLKKNVPPCLHDNSENIKDSMSLASQFNLKSPLENIDEDEDIAINIEETVVMISISDKMLFNPGRRIMTKANDILQKIANQEFEESLDVMVRSYR
jgi:chemotaxis protein MotB